MRLDGRAVIHDTVGEAAAIADLHDLSENASVQGTARADDAVCANYSIPADMGARLDNRAVADQRAGLYFGVGRNIGFAVDVIALCGAGAARWERRFDLAAEAGAGGTLLPRRAPAVPPEAAPLGGQHAAALRPNPR